MCPHSRPRKRSIAHAYITKSGGRWRLTKAGEDALKQNPGDFILGAVKKYREWKSTRPEQHYEKIRESGKALLPLVKLSFLAPAEG